MSDTETTETEVAPTPAPNKVTHLTTAERAAHGRAARADAPRTSQGTFDTHPERDPVAIIDAESAGRVPELVPIRYGRMLVSPFTFYRGAAAIMAHDLAPTPRAGLKVQLCGDAHLSNFGGFASPDRALVFDLNDFDETRARAVRVGRQASRDELRDLRARQRLLRRRAEERRPRRHARLPQRDARLRGDGQPRGLVLAARREHDRGATPRGARSQAGEGDGCGRCEGADEGQPQGTVQADARRGRRGADHLRPAA